MYKFTIPLQPITKKNHQQIWKNRATGKPFITQSDKYKEYENAALWYLKPLKISCEVNVKAIYYMSTRRKVDLINLHSALHDILVKAQTLVDDNCKIVVSTDGSKVLYDKENPRTEIFIENIMREVEQV